MPHPFCMYVQKDVVATIDGARNGLPNLKKALVDYNFLSYFEKVTKL